MKLIAIGERRSDNTVVLLGADRREYTFRAEAGGDLVCDIEDDATVELALSATMLSIMLLALRSQSAWSCRNVSKSAITVSAHSGPVC